MDISVEGIHYQNTIVEGGDAWLYPHHPREAIRLPEGKMIGFSERVMWEFELAVAREGMLTKGKRYPDPGQLDVTNDLHITGKKTSHDW